MYKVALVVLEYRLPSIYPDAIHLTVTGLIVMFPGIVSEDDGVPFPLMTIPRLVIVLDVDSVPLICHCIGTLLLVTLHS